MAFDGSLGRFSAIFPENNVGFLQPHVQVMRDVGFDVSEAETVDIANSLLDVNSYDAAFVDDEMRGESGLTLIPRILQNNPNTRIVVLSAYKSPEDRETVLSTYGLPNETNLIVKSKSQARLSTGRFEALVRDVYDACANDLRLKSEDSFKYRKWRKFDISFDRYEAMTPMERSAVESGYIEHYAKRIQTQIFDSGAIWGVYFGEASKPAFTARRPSEILDYRTVLKEAERCKKMPYQITAAGLSEDGGLDCAYPQLIDYPKIAFQFDGLQSPDGALLEAHVDTGTLDIFLNGKYLLESGYLDEPPPTTKFSLNGTAMDVARLRDIKIEVQNRGMNSDSTRPEVTFAAWIVMSPWEDVEVFARCKTARKNPGNFQCGNEDHSDVCVYRRVAFFGRSLYIESGTDFHVCGVSSGVSLIRNS